MKKLLFILCCTMAFLSSCSNDDLSQDNNNGNNSTSDKIRWYGVKTVDSQATTRGVADEANLWNQRIGIYVKFLNDPKGNVTLEKIQEIASEWEQYAGVKFHFVNGDAKASVRIAFDWNDNDWLTWSYTGTDAKMIKDQTQPTAVFGGLQYQDDEQLRGDVLRVFGQILGLEYEQRHQDWDSWKSETKLENYWTDMFDGMNMDWDQIREYVFTPLTQENAVASNQTPEIDELSIMAWPYYSRVQTSKLIANFELSEGDKAFIAELYPKEKQTLPTIQEAWVDAGFFEWTDSTKTALKITELGSKQETFPDVSDGEQLKSALDMFKKSIIKKVPSFNTSNITNFSGMFYDCAGLKTIPQIDTSKGLDFNRIFMKCTSLTTIPLLETSNADNFTSMFEGCSSLTTIPLLNTSNASNFNWMFTDCTSLTKIPLLDTSNGTDFLSMFLNCTSLTHIPNLDTAKGTDFAWMFSNCTSLTTIPLLNTSNASYFNWMFCDCTSLVSIPDLDTSKGNEFYYMFNGCSRLQEKPILDLSNATDTTDMYRGTPFANDPI